MASIQCKLQYCCLQILLLLACSVHIWVIVRRFQKHEVVQTSATERHQSLPLPGVVVIFNNIRNQTSPSYGMEAINMSFSAFFDGYEFPFWASQEVHTRMQHYISLNAVNYANLQKMNKTLDEIRNKWPIQTSIANNLSNLQGIQIIGRFNATNFITYQDSNGNRDNIQVIINSFEVDNPSSNAIGMTYYHLNPCEAVSIALALERYKKLNRPESRCRDDYPDNLKKMLIQPMTTDYLYNPIFAPFLPYDQQTCAILCAAEYWLPKCDCYVSYDTYQYAGEPSDVPICPPYEKQKNCTRNAWTEAPGEVIQRCECHSKCNSVGFRVINVEKISYGYGT